LEWQQNLVLALGFKRPASVCSGLPTELRHLSRHCSLAQHPLSLFLL
jgi:hypothetical protein